ncbi:MAG: acetate kinase [Bacteroidota bacterium]
MAKILVLNAGSSSIKFQLFEMDRQEVEASGLVERIGEPRGRVNYRKFQNGQEQYETTIEEAITDHQQGLNAIGQLLLDQENGALKNAGELQAVGHRVVHGAELFSEPVLITDEILAKLREISFLAPLHNPANLKGIEVSKRVFPKAYQIAVFDTAFHQTLPDYAYRFPIPGKFYSEHGLRVYGFHGTSHAFVSRAAADHLRKPLSEFNAITLHLGNGCSAAAIKGGKSVDVSMGLTPLGGLIMGTRSGDIDPSLCLFMADHLGMTTSEIDKTLNKESGLKGLTGDNDLRNILAAYENGVEDARLAIEMYTYRIKKYVGAYIAALGRVDALIFTAGVGENSALIRRLVCQEMEVLGLSLDHEQNDLRSAGIRLINKPSGSVKILVVPTNEELEIATQSMALLNGN